MLLLVEVLLVHYSAVVTEPLLAVIEVRHNLALVVYGSGYQVLRRRCDVAGLLVRTISHYAATEIRKGKCRDQYAAGPSARSRYKFPSIVANNWPPFW